MDIRNVGGSGQPIPILPQGDHAANAGRQPASTDQVEISAAGHQAARVGSLARAALELPESRPDAVAAARAALERGDLDSPAAFLAAARALRPAK
jgi:hypothetical protein